MDNDLRKINTLTMEEKLNLPLSKIKMSSRLFNILKKSEFRCPENGNFKIKNFQNLGQILDYFKKADESYFYLVGGFGRTTRLELFKLIQHSFPEEFEKKIDMWNPKLQTYTFE